VKELAAMDGVYRPKGVEFYDQATRRQMILVGTDEPQTDLHGWLCYKHPDGQWVTLRKASSDDTYRVMAEVSRAFHDD
jgi:hypothetical protein